MCFVEVPKNGSPRVFKIGSAKPPLHFLIINMFQSSPQQPAGNAWRIPRSTLENAARSGILRLRQCMLHSIPVIPNAEAITVMDVSDNKIQRLDEIVNYPNLCELMIDGNPLTDISALVQLKHLQWVNIENCQQTLPAEIMRAWLSGKQHFRSSARDVAPLLEYLGEKNREQFGPGFRHQAVPVNSKSPFHVDKDVVNEDNRRPSMDDIIVFNQDNVSERIKNFNQTRQLLTQDNVAEAMTHREIGSDDSTSSPPMNPRNKQRNIDLKSDIFGREAVEENTKTSRRFKNFDKFVAPPTYKEFQLEKRPNAVENLALKNPYAWKIALNGEQMSARTPAQNGAQNMLATSGSQILSARSARSSPTFQSALFTSPPAIKSLSEHLSTQSRRFAARPNSRLPSLFGDEPNQTSSKWQSEAHYEQSNTARRANDVNQNVATKNVSHNIVDNSMPVDRHHSRWIDGRGPPHLQSHVPMTHKV